MGAPTGSTAITCDLHNSVEFHKQRNLVRDQRVGGSNPIVSAFSKMAQVFSIESKEFRSVVLEETCPVLRAN